MQYLAADIPSNTCIPCMQSMDAQIQFNSLHFRMESHGPQPAACTLSPAYKIQEFHHPSFPPLIRCEALIALIPQHLSSVAAPEESFRHSSLTNLLNSSYYTSGLRLPFGSPLSPAIPCAAGDKGGAAEEATRLGPTVIPPDPSIHFPGNNKSIYFYKLIHFL